MFSSLMPNRSEFFELLTAHSEQVVAGANATLRLINGLGDAGAIGKCCGIERTIIVGLQCSVGLLDDRQIKRISTCFNTKQWCCEGI